MDSFITPQPLLLKIDAGWDHPLLPWKIPPNPQLSCRRPLQGQTAQVLPPKGPDPPRVTALYISHGRAFHLVLRHLRGTRKQCGYSGKIRWETYLFPCHIDIPGAVFCKGILVMPLLPYYNRAGMWLWYLYLKGIDRSSLHPHSHLVPFT